MEYAEQPWRIPQGPVQPCDRKVLVDRWMNGVPTSSPVASDDFLLYPATQTGWAINSTSSPQTNPPQQRWPGDELHSRFIGNSSYPSSIDGSERGLSRSHTISGVPFERPDTRNALYTTSNNLPHSLSPEQSSSPLENYRSSLDGSSVHSPRELARLAELNGIKVHNSEHRCWQHGCNGRSFTTRSNLTRHQRERSNARSVYVCPRCDYKFSRKLARDQHVQHQRCTKLPRWPTGRQSLASASMVPRSTGFDLEPANYMGMSMVN